MSSSWNLNLVLGHLRSSYHQLMAGLDLRSLMKKRHFFFFFFFLSPCLFSYCKESWGVEACVSQSAFCR